MYWSDYLVESFDGNDGVLEGSCPSAGCSNDIKMYIREPREADTIYVHVYATILFRNPKRPADALPPFSIIAHQQSRKNTK